MKNLTQLVHEGGTWAEFKVPMELTRLLTSRSTKVGTNITNTRALAFLAEDIDDAILEYQTQKLIH